MSAVILGLAVGFVILVCAILGALAVQIYKSAPGFWFYAAVWTPLLLFLGATAVFHH